MSEILRIGIKQQKIHINLQSGTQTLKAIIRPRIQETIHQSLIHRRREIIHPEPLHHHEPLQEDRIMAVAREKDKL